MGDTLNPSRVSSLKVFSKICAAVTFAIGTLVMLGWTFDIPALKSIIPVWVSMKPNTALCFILLGLGLLLMHSDKGRRLAPYLSALAILIGLLTLCEYVFYWNSGIDQLLFREPPGAVDTSAPGRMAPNTAVSFLLVGLALLMLDLRPRLNPSRLFAILGGLIGLLAAIGYAYGVTVFRDIGHYTAMALNTAIASVAFSAGLICARPERGIVGIAASDTSGATVLRRMLPITLGVAFVLGWLVSWGERAGLYGSTEGTAIYAVLLMIVLASLAASTATRLHKADGDRQEAQREMHSLALFPEQNPNPTMRIASSGEVLYANSSANELLCALGWMPGKPAPDVLAEPTLGALRAADERSIVELTDAAHRIVSIEIVPITDEGYVNLYGRDITKRKQAEAALWEAKENLEIRVRERTAELEQAVTALQAEVVDRLRAESAAAAERQQFNDVLETLPSYLVLLTPDYHVPFANRFFRKRFGESEGRRCYEYLFGRTEPCEICETYTVMKTNAPHRWEWLGPDGRNYDIYDFPFTDTDGTALILEMGIDITERKQAEAELEKHRDHLEELVMERTGELETANSMLQTEITERKKAEEALYSQVHALQRALLPPKPLAIPGYAQAYTYIPALAGEEIGGDFYDIFRTESGKVGILIGDVSGKGIQAAALAAGTRSTIRAFAYEQPSPAEAMSHANRLLTAQQASFESFVTVFLLILDLETGRLTYCSAGHPPAVVYRMSGKIELLGGSNLPLGVTGGVTYSQEESNLTPGDSVILYTDGVTEARRGADLFGIEGLLKVIGEHGGEGSEAIVEQIIASASSFAKGKLRDDTAIIVIGRSNNG